MRSISRAPSMRHDPFAIPLASHGFQNCCCGSKLKGVRPGIMRRRRVADLGAEPGIERDYRRKTGTPKSIRGGKFRKLGHPGAILFCRRLTPWIVNVGRPTRPPPVTKPDNASAPSPIDIRSANGRETAPLKPDRIRFPFDDLRTHKATIARCFCE